MPNADAEASEKVAVHNGVGAFAWNHAQASPFFLLVLPQANHIALRIRAASCKCCEIACRTGVVTHNESPVTGFPTRMAARSTTYLNRRWRQAAETVWWLPSSALFDFLFTPLFARELDLFGDIAGTFRRELRGFFVRHGSNVP